LVREALFQNVSLFINSIFGEIGDYDPTATTREYEKKEKAKERDRKKSKNSTSYFEKSEGGVDDEVYVIQKCILSRIDVPEFC